METSMKHKKKGQKTKFSKPVINETRQSLGEDLHHLDADKTITTDESETHKRRTVELHSTSGTWGFTLQTYGVKHKKTGTVDIMTYIDYVEVNGPAWYGGIRRGDIIIAVNGESVEDHTHKQLVRVIQSCKESMRLVVVFDDCCRKVELHDRYFRLKALLRSKLKELKVLEEKEKCIRTGQFVPLNRWDASRASLMSTSTIASNASWDAYSIISSPYSIEDLSPGNHNMSDSKENLYIDSDSTSESSLSFYEDAISIDIANDAVQLHKNKNVQLLKYRKLHGNFPLPNVPHSGKFLNRDASKKLYNGQNKKSLSASCINIPNTFKGTNLARKRSISQEQLHKVILDTNLYGSVDVHNQNTNEFDNVQNIEITGHPIQEFEGLSDSQNFSELIAENCINNSTIKECNECLKADDFETNGREKSSASEISDSSETIIIHTNALVHCDNTQLSVSNNTNSEIFETFLNVTDMQPSKDKISSIADKSDINSDCDDELGEQFDENYVADFDNKSEEAKYSNFIHNHENLVTKDQFHQLVPSVSLSDTGLFFVETICGPPLADVENFDLADDAALASSYGDEADNNEGKTNECMKVATQESEPSSLSKCKTKEPLFDMPTQEILQTDDNVNEVCSDNKIQDANLFGNTDFHKSHNLHSLEQIQQPNHETIIPNLAVDVENETGNYDAVSIGLNAVRDNLHISKCRTCHLLKTEENTDPDIESDYLPNAEHHICNCDGKCICLACYNCDKSKLCKIETTNISKDNPIECDNLSKNAVECENLKNCESFSKTSEDTVVESFLGLSDKNISDNDKHTSDSDKNTRDNHLENEKSLDIVLNKDERLKIE